MYLENKKTNITINILKCYAALIVFICHTYIVCKNAFHFEFTTSWQFVLKTPAWAGVWVFMIVAGFLAADGFFHGRYELTKKGILAYYKNRLIKIIIPTWIMISLVYILADSQFVSGKIVLDYLTCMYRGEGGASGVGATWYVFSIVWLYLLTPLFIFVIQRINNNSDNKEKVYIFLFCIILILGIVYRVGGRKIGLTWYRWIYASPLGNIDLFFGGMIVKQFKEIRKIKWKKGRAVGLFFVLIILMLACSFMYFYGETTKHSLLSLYRYIMPTAVLIVVGGITQLARKRAS